MKKIRRMTAMFMAILMMVCSTGMTAFADELPADKSTETDKGVFTDEISVSDTDIIQNDTVSDGDVASDGFERSYSVGNTVTLYMTEQTPDIWNSTDEYVWTVSEIDDQHVTFKTDKFINNVNFKIPYPEDVWDGVKSRYDTYVSGNAFYSTGNLSCGINAMLLYSGGSATYHNVDATEAAGEDDSISVTVIHEYYTDGNIDGTKKEVIYKKKQNYSYSLIVGVDIPKATSYMDNYYSFTKVDKTIKVPAGATGSQGTVTLRYDRTLNTDPPASYAYSLTWDYNGGSVGDDGSRTQDVLTDAASYTFYEDAEGYGSPKPELEGHIFDGWDYAGSGTFNPVNGQIYMEGSPGSTVSGILTARWQEDSSIQERARIETRLDLFEKGADGSIKGSLDHSLLPDTFTLSYSCVYDGKDYSGTWTMVDADWRDDGPYFGFDLEYDADAGDTVEVSITGSDYGIDGYTCTGLNQQGDTFTGTWPVMLNGASMTAIACFYMPNAVPAPVLSVTKEVRLNDEGEWTDSVTAGPGDWATFRITVTNNGAGPALGVQLSDSAVYEDGSDVVRNVWRDSEGTHLPDGPEEFGIAAGESIVFYMEHTVSKSEMESHDSIHNTAWIQGTEQPEDPQASIRFYRDPYVITGIVKRLLSITVDGNVTDMTTEGAVAPVLRVGQEAVLKYAVEVSGDSGAAYTVSDPGCQPVGSGSLSGTLDGSGKAMFQFMKSVEASEAGTLTVYNTAYVVPGDDTEFGGDGDLDPDLEYPSNEIATEIRVERYLKSLSINVAKCFSFPEGDWSVDDVPKDFVLEYAYKDADGKILKSGVLDFSEMTVSMHNGMPRLQGSIDIQDVPFEIGTVTVMERGYDVAGMEYVGVTLPNSLKYVWRVTESDDGCISLTSATGSHLTGSSLEFTNDYMKLSNPEYTVTWNETSPI